MMNETITEEWELVLKEQWEKFIIAMRFYHEPSANPRLYRESKYLEDSIVL